jgi:hypothetical protein
MLAVRVAEGRKRLRGQSATIGHRFSVDGITMIAIFTGEAIGKQKGLWRF